MWLLGLDDKERVEKVLGKEFCTLYYNECSQIPYCAVTTSRVALGFGRCNGMLNNRVYYDLNPVGTGHFTYSLFIEGRKPGGIGVAAHPEDYVYLYVEPVWTTPTTWRTATSSRLMEMPEQQRKPVLQGHYVARCDGALWTLEGIEHTAGCGRTIRFCRSLLRIVVAVDPSGASG